MPTLFDPGGDTPEAELRRTKFSNRQFRSGGQQLSSASAVEYT
jgi:hypothetical protein